MTTFSPGDLVLRADDPRWSWRVVAVESNALVHAVRGNAKVIAPAELLLRAPEGWEDAPDRPLPPVDMYDDRATVEAFKALNVSYAAHQRALDDWRSACERWDHEHRQPLLESLP